MLVKVIIIHFSVKEIICFDSLQNVERLSPFSFHKIFYKKNDNYYD